MKLKNIIKIDFVFPLFLLSIVSFLCFKSYIPNTWLSGWDTLHPEFNFPLNISRVLFGVWRSEQGLGAVAIHSHMSELPRLLFLWILSLVFNYSILRYLYIFLALFIGPLGVYFFIKQTSKTKNLWIDIASLLGALYYLLNLGTLQHFYVPFEMFATQYAALPWIILFSIRTLENNSRKNLIVLFVVSFLSSPQAYAATLFYMFYLVLIVFLFTYSLFSKRNKILTLKRSIISLTIVLTANLFWVLPNLYAIKNQSQAVEQSTINRLFSGEIFLRNKEYADLGSAITHKNFLFSWQEYNYEDGKFVDLLDEWKDYLEKPFVSSVVNIIAGMWVIGLLLSIFRKDRVGISLLPVFFLSLFLLLNENPPFGYFFNFIRDNIPILREGLRTPFTKISIVFMFVASYGISSFYSSVFIFIKKIRLSFVNYLLVIAGISMIVFSMLPVFSGNLISKSMKINIPDYYFETFNWFENQPDGRILKLPMHTKWGWVYYDWGYQGAGFTWFGTKQAQLDRDFDRWSEQNETAYLQFQDAIVNNDLDKFSSLIDKYSIQYVLVDKSVINAGGDSNLLFNKESDEILSKLGGVTEIKNFGSTTVYKINGHDSVWAPSRVTKVNTNLEYSYNDPIYGKFENYYSGKNAVIYPFLNFDTRSGIDMKLDNDTLKISRDVYLPTNANLNFSSYVGEEKTIPFSLNTRLENGLFSTELVYTQPELFLDGKLIDENKIVIKGDTKYPASGIGYVSAFGEINRISVGKELSEIADGHIDGFNFSPQYYSQDSKVAQSVLDKIAKTSPRICRDSNSVADSLRVVDQDFLITPDGNDSLCWGNSYIAQNNELMEISFTANKSAIPDLCISQGGRCVNISNPEVVDIDGGESHVTFFGTLNRGEVWIDFIIRPSEKEKKLMIKNLRVETYSLVNKEDYDLTNIKQLLGKTLSKSIDQPNANINLEVAIPGVGSRNIDLNSTVGYSESYNCDTQKLGSVEKVVSDGTFRYLAKNGGVNCDYVTFSGVEPEKSYVLRIKGVNVNGRSLKTYIFDGGKLILEDVMPDGDFEKLMAVPRLHGDGSLHDLTLNIETRSFGIVGSENIVNEVELIPLPADWLSSINMGNNLIIEDNNVEILKQSNFGNMFHRIVLNSADERGVVSFSQSYEPGWLAYLPGYGLLVHSKFNSWANAWEVPAGEHTVYLIYWPQLLEFIGLALIPVVLLLLVSKSDIIARFASR